jgi:hypothetical protein
MNDENLYASSGPVSSMPGSSHSLPPGTMCDHEGHEQRPAVKRIQGETDSFGCEYVCMCQECVDQHAEHKKQYAQEEHYCDWHKGMGLDVRPRRDPDEGQAGPVYQVCEACRKKDIERTAREAEEYYAEHGDIVTVGIFDDIDDLFDHDDRI